MKKIRIILADDHQLFRKGLINILNQTDDLAVAAEASNGLDVIKILEEDPSFDLLLLDLNMPYMNGLETVIRLKKRGIKIPTLILSMEENEFTIIQLIRLGVKGYILKDESPENLKQGIRLAIENKYFLNGFLSPRLQSAISEMLNGEESELVKKLTDRELEFLRLTASDHSYKEIANKMGISSRTADSYRDILFVKLQVKSRIGLALFAIKRGLVYL